MGAAKQVSEGRSGKIFLILGCLALILGFAAWQYFGGSTGVPGGMPPTQAYFTDDDGKTIFKDDLNKLAPFDHNGKPAVKAYCFTTDGKTYWVGYLERYTTAGKKAVEAFQQRKPEDQDPIEGTKVMAAAKEVKPPGAPEAEWTPATNFKKYGEIVAVKLPADKSGDARPYVPG